MRLLHLRERHPLTPALPRHVEANRLLSRWVHVRDDSRIGVRVRKLPITREAVVAAIESENV